MTGGEARDGRTHGLGDRSQGVEIIEQRASVNLSDSGRACVEGEGSVMGAMDSGIGL